MVLGLYQKENRELKEKIAQLESKIDSLIRDKEDMLRQERERIEALYNKKDEQLKNILELINSKLMLEHQQPQTIHEVESYDEEREVEPNEMPHAKNFVELREYLRTLDLKSYQRKIIKRRFLALYDSDVRIIQQNGKLYLDFSKYDYTDLLTY